MASYPGAVKSFTAKADGAGNKIFAAHINDIQDEVTAIEDGLLNGTAPINSSRITAPASQITNSTVTALSVTGGSTFTGSIICSSVITAAAQPRFNGFSTTTQNIAANSTSVLSLLSEDIDVGGLHSTAATPSRVTIPVGSSGIYFCHGQTFVVFTGALTVGDTARLFLRKTGTDQYANQVFLASTVSMTANGNTLAVSGLMALDAGDYVELAGAAAGSAWVAGSAVPQFTTRLHVMKVW